MVGEREKFEKALALHRNGDFSRAARLYRSVLKSAPRHFGAAHMLGAVYLQQREYDDAVRQIRRALQIDPDSPEARNNLGTALKNAARLDEALAEYDRALALRPDYPHCLCNSANALSLLGRSAEAIARYDRAIQLRPDYAEACFNRGRVLEGLQRWKEAEASYRKAIELDPSSADAHHGLANALNALRDDEEALASIDRALAHRTGDAVLLTTRGNILADAGRLDDALASHDAALAARPGFAAARNNRGFVQRALLRLDAAAADYERAMALDPEFAEARWNLGLLQLLRGDWKNGWRNYEARFDKTNAAAVKLDRVAPEWKGETVQGRRILLFGEQGFGDVIQFARFARHFSRNGAHVILRVKKKLHRLLSDIAPGVELADSSAPPPAADHQLALMSVPHALNLTSEAFAPDIPYLHAEPARTEIWRERLGNHGFKVGVCWQGNPAPRIDRGRSIPLREFQPIAAIDGVRLLSLQKHDGMDQLERVPQDMTVERPSISFDETDAFVDTAAIIANLDLVITSDTAIAHLAGAMGRPVWVLLKQVPDWRWLLEREDSPWYPTMRLFRQSEAGDWAGVMQRVAQALRDTAGDAVHDSLQSVA
ncbi:MAG: tetratricopeptide repeat protein [Rhizomicrobium sp.]